MRRGGGGLGRDSSTLRRPFPRLRQHGALPRYSGAPQADARPLHSLRLAPACAATRCQRSRRSASLSQQEPVLERCARSLDAQHRSRSRGAPLNLGMLNAMPEVLDPLPISFTLCLQPRQGRRSRSLPEEGRDRVRKTNVQAANSQRGPSSPCRVR